MILSKYISVASIAVLLLFVGCKKLTDININSNESEVTHPQSLLPKIEWEAFRTWRGTDPLYALKMIVRTDGEHAYQIYTWQRGTFSQYQHLRNITKMEEEATKIASQGYIALAKFFRAYYFYNLTLTFGDIPYTEAAKGESLGIFNPKYDSQKEVFVGILQELEEASAILKSNADDIIGDIIYEGSVSRWDKLVNSFRLKVLITLVDRTNDFPFSIAEEFARIVAQENIINAINGSEDGQLFFLNQEDNRYPEFNANNYSSSMYMDSTFIQHFQDLRDPRLFAIANQTRVGKEEGKAENDFSSYEGGDPIVPYTLVNQKAVRGQLSKVRERYYEDPTAEPLVLLGYSELQFIIAEAIWRGWLVGDMKQHYDNGIRSSFQFYEKYAKNMSNYFTENQVVLYLSQNNVSFNLASTSTDQLERIIIQKYLRSFHQGGFSAYFDHLRTGYPSLRKANNVQVAYRWMYPLDEYNNNTEQVAIAIQSQFDGNDAIHIKPWWIN